MVYEPYLDFGLTSFEDILKAFTQFKDGGYWVKKLVKKGGFYREVVEGPYKKKEAEKEAEDWKDYFQYKGKLTAEVYTFFTLCCDFEIDKSKKDYLYEEYTWQPPKGIDLFCLIYQPTKILVVNRKELNDPNFQKFYNYAKNENINDIEIYDNIIYYNDKNYKSIIGARVAKRIITDFISLKREKNILLEYLTDNKLANEFIAIPQYLTDYKTSCFSLTLSTFKEYLEISNCNKRISNFYDKIYKCLPQENFHFQEEGIRLDFYLLLSNRDYQAKVFRIIKHDSYDLIIGDEENYIKLINISNCNAQLKVRMDKDDEEFIENYAQGDKKFQEIENYIGLLFYIGKCLGIKNITFKADQEVSCICDNNNIMLYQELIYLLADKPSLYQKLGFKNKGIEEKIAKYRSITVGQLLQKDETEIENDIFAQKSIQEVAQLYLKDICNYEYGCSLMSEINRNIYSQIKDSMEYSLDLHDKNLKNLRSLF